MAIYNFNKLNSTNLHLKQNFNNYKKFDIILAEHQSNGYGRFKRQWLDLGGENIFMSMCLKLDGFNENIVGITQFTALILAKTFEIYGIQPTIKWPNDIHVNGRKISGILAESVIKNSKFEGIVLGLGININSDEKMFDSVSQKVTSLSTEISKKINKDEFIENFVQKFEADYEKLLDNGFSIFKNVYISYLNCIDKEIKVKNYDKTFTGIARNVSDNGLLILETNGELKEISAGDIEY